jgi:hypothetical protein
MSIIHDGSSTSSLSYADRVRDAGGIDCGRDGSVLCRPRRHPAAGGSCDMARLQSRD